MELEQILKAWQEFVDNEKILPVVSPMVVNSWWRCKARINPFPKVRFKKLNPDHLLAAQVSCFDLISIARPIMEDIYQNIEHEKLGIILMNGTGYVLDILGTPEVLDEMMAIGFAPGVICTEEHIGTNAFGMALNDRMPVQIVGPEHYCRQFHQLADSAAPIFDLTGRPLGVLGVVSRVNYFNQDYLGLVVAGAKAIEAQHQADFMLLEYNNQLAQMHVILDTISEGIIVWSKDQFLMHFNESAEKILDFALQPMIGVKLATFVKYPDFVIQAIKKREPLTDVEAAITIDKRTLHLLISLRYVYNKDSLQWMISTFRPIKEVRQLVQRQVGAHASFTLDDILGESVLIKKMRGMIRSAASATASILIRGEGGTGKNIIASAIHNESNRREGPFLIFPTSSIPNELMLSELVGYEEGGSKRSGSRPSKFELAQGGTIYFQDVDSLSLEAQGILLNFIELKVIQRLGSDRPIEVDVRVIASSSANIEKLITERHFRSDLYYRLSAFIVNLPPLRERATDIPIYVERIVKRLSRQLDCQLSLGEGVTEALCKYPWPGNIRELESVLGPAAALAASTGVFELEHLPRKFRRQWVMTDENQKPIQIQTLEQIERDAIDQTARVWRGNLSDMASALGIGRTTLWRRIKKYNILLDHYQNS